METHERIIVQFHWNLTHNMKCVHEPLGSTFSTIYPKYMARSIQSL